LAAESSVRAELARWRAEGYRDMITGAVREVGTDALGPKFVGSSITTIERLAGPLYLLRAHAITEGGTEARAAVVVRGLELGELWTGFPAALATHAPIELWGDDAVVGFNYDIADGTGEGRCLTDAIREMQEVFGYAERAAILNLPASPPPALHLGPLDGTDLQRLADRIELGTVAPAPIESSTGCDLAAAGNWGAPRRPWSRCGGYFPLIFAPGDLHITGGAGQGVLVVRGDLTISGDAEFFGAVLVEGRLLLRDQAQIFGAARVFDDAGLTLIEGAGRLAYEPCALRAALAGALALNRAFRPADRAWVPQF
jgi:hypothetical protein